MSKKVLVILAEGFEEIEAVTIIDVLRRAGLNVTIAGLKDKHIRGGNNIYVQADTELAQYKDIPDAVILPGGTTGAQNLGNSPAVAEIVKKAHSQKKVVGAICAAPALALKASGVLEGKKATCYPGFESYFSPNVKFLQERVVIDENIITSRGPGSSLEFALELVAQLAGKEKARELKEGMLVLN